jgi:hypothetical protein
MLRKISRIAFSVMILLSILLNSTPVVISDAELPEWEVGDKWSYETPYYGLTLEERREVTNITTINVNGTNYDVYVLQTTASSLPWGDFTSYNYISISNMALVRTMVIWSYGTNGTETITIYQPPLENFDFPLSVGKTWTSTYTSSQYDETTGYINWTETLYYQVTGTEKIKVKAGTFKCYVIEESNEWGDISQRTWYSSEVKNSVKKEDIGRITIEKQLTSYSIKGMGDEEKFGIPTRFIIILIISIPIILILLINNVIVRKKRKEAGKDVVKQRLSEKAHISGGLQSEINTQQSKPFPPSFQESSIHQQHICPTCGQSLSFIQQYSKWYCPSCERYL